jgi:hypothetical protein
MKKLISILLIVFLAVSCQEAKNKKEYKFYLVTKSGNFSTYINCDSVTMVSHTEAFIWVDGTKSKIVADRINIGTNTYFR